MLPGRSQTCCSRQENALSAHITPIEKVEQVDPAAQWQDAQIKPSIQSLILNNIIDVDLLAVL
jgi:hypothetical protein